MQLIDLIRFRVMGLGYCQKAFVVKLALGLELRAKDKVTFTTNSSCCLSHDTIKLALELELMGLRFHVMGLG